MALLTTLSTAGLGAGLMYLLDPNRGRRRRAQLRNRMTAAVHQLQDAADTTWRDVRHRAYGTVAEARSLVRRDQPADEVLCERVRAKLGRYVSHPSSIHVSADQGRVTLDGLILAEEVDDLLAAVYGIKGVVGIDNRLQAHAERGNISGLQGGVHREGERPDMLQENWSPATRLAVGTAGSVLMANCLMRRTPSAVVLGTLGFGMFLRSVSNLEVQRAFGFGGGRRGIEIQKTITINAPVEQVFDLLSNPTNYPKFTDIVKHVESLEGDRYHKTLAGPAGVEILLDEIMTRRVPSEYVAWRSGPNSTISYAGLARFERAGDSATRVHVRQSYNPPGGVVAHTLASALGYDPKTLFDDVLMRAKSFLETGVQPHDAAERTPMEAAAREI